MKIIFTAFAVLAALGTTVQAADDKPRPNIIVILADDMGFSDLGCYGSEIPTPNLDALAADGLRFTNFHNMSRCCPSRATLLTGLYSHQAGVGHMTEPSKIPSYEGYLNQQCVTEAEVLDPAGYSTIMVGKWHVGQNHGVAPWTRGFQMSLNSIAGGFYWSSSPRARLFLNGKEIGNGQGVLPMPWYSTDLWTEYGLKFIDQATSSSKKPFYLYLAENAPHFPLDAPADEIAKFRHGIYMQGWDKLRQARYDRQVKMGIIEPKWEISPRDPEVPAWDSLSAEKKDIYDKTMATYAADIAHLDTQVGVLVAGLKKRGLYDNTVIFFLSDNGANAEGVDGTDYRTIEDGHSPDAHLGRSWANLGNTPFRMFKHYEHEGGTSSPFIVHWTDGIKEKGVLRPQLGEMIDIMPTVADLAGATYPTDLNGHTIQPEEGVSLVPAFDKDDLLSARTNPLFWEHEGNRAINDGHWKLVAKRGEPWELYDFYAHRTELTQYDEAAQKPDIVKTLSAEWDAWAKRVGAAEMIPGASVMGKMGGKGKRKGGAAAAPETEMPDE